MKNGILIVNKPENITSFDVLRTLKKCLNTQEIGHAGTLDPLATGVMVVLVGSGTKLSYYLLENDKTYVAGILLGARSNTFDSTGIIEYQDTKEITLNQIKNVCDNLLGTHNLLPPSFSAIHVHGVRAYDLARQGVEVILEKRPMTLLDYEILDFNKVKQGYQLNIKLHVSKGTYIRSIAQEIGEQLGCGGLMNRLNRISSGPFTIEESYDLVNIDETTPLISNLEALKRKGMTIIPINQKVFNKVNDGRTLEMNEIMSKENCVALSYNEELVGIYILDDLKKIWKAKRIWRLSI